MASASSLFYVYSNDRSPPELCYCFFQKTNDFLVTFETIEVTFQSKQVVSLTSKSEESEFSIIYGAPTDMWIKGADVERHLKLIFPRALGHLPDLCEPQTFRLQSGEPMACSGSEMEVDPGVDKYIGKKCLRVGWISGEKSKLCCLSWRSLGALEALSKPTCDEC